MLGKRNLRKLSVELTFVLFCNKVDSLNFFLNLKRSLRLIIVRLKKICCIINQSVSRFNLTSSAVFFGYPTKNELRNATIEFAPLQIENSFKNLSQDSSFFSVNRNRHSGGLTNSRVALYVRNTALVLPCHSSKKQRREIPV